jgi:hypothetical protein
MLKKIVGGAILIGLIGVLVAGAVYRTLDRADRVEQGGRALGTGRGGSGEDAELAVGRGRGQTAGTVQNNSVESGNPGGGNGRGRGQSTETTQYDLLESGNPGGGNGRGGGDAAQRQYPNYETAPAEWSTFEGIVVQVPDTGVELVIQTIEGEQLVIGTGPLDLAAQSFSLKEGEAVRMMGYWEDGEFKAAQLTQLQTGQTLALRDEVGRPAWSGQGGNAQSTARDGAGTVESDTWVEIVGRVVAVDETSLIVATADGQEIEITGRPWRFAQEIGFWAGIGDSLTLTGFFDGEAFEAALIGYSNGQTAVLRDQSGRPMWAGGGQRGG